MTVSSSTRRSAAVAVAALALLTAGCGARWDAEEQATVIAKYEGGGGGGGTGGTATGNRPASGGTATTAPGGGGGATGGGTGTEATGGGTDGGSGGEGGQPAAPADLACAAPTEAPGVTDDTLTVGNISTLSGPIPGLGASSAAAVQAYVEYRNSVGGVCGRQIELRAGDDGADNARNRSLTTELEPQVIGFVGGIAGGQAGSVDVVEQTQVPYLANALSPDMPRVASYFDIDPDFGGSIMPKYRYMVEQGATKAAIVYIDQAGLERDVQRPLMEAAGMQVVLDLPLPLSTLSYDSAARQVANSGAQYMLFIHEAGGSASMAQSMQDTGYELQFMEFIAAYGTNFIELAGEAGEGSMQWIRSLPTEDGGQNPEQALFLQWMGQVAPDAPLDTFAMDAWGSAKAFFDALEAIPGPITRESFVATLAGVTGYDAGGFFGPIELGAKRSNGCQIAMRVEGGQWTRVVPDQGFLC